MASARNETPKVPRWVGCGEGCLPPQRGEVWVGGYASFGAFWELILLHAVKLPVLHA